MHNLKICVKNYDIIFRITAYISTILNVNIMWDGHENAPCRPLVRGTETLMQAHSGRHGKASNLD